MRARMNNFHLILLPLRVPWKAPEVSESPFALRVATGTVCCSWKAPRPNLLAGSIALLRYTASIPTRLNTKYNISHWLSPAQRIHGSAR